LRALELITDRPVDVFVGYLSLLDATRAARRDVDDRMPGPVDEAG
jgi:hypothetical protein